MNVQPELDADLEALRRAQRNRRLAILGTIAALPLGIAVYTFVGKLSVASDLKAEGYTEVDVSIRGPFMFAYTAARAGDTCTGTQTRVFGFQAGSRQCTHIVLESEVPKEPPPPPRNLRAEIEEKLGARFKPVGFSRFECPEVGDKDEISCTLSAANGATVPVRAAVTKRGADGLWNEWTTHTAHPVVLRTKLAKQLADGIDESWKKSGRKATATVSCGEGPLVLAKAASDATPPPIECEVTASDRPKPGKAAVTVDAENDKMRWTLSGI